MGAVKIDKNKNERRLQALFPTDSEEGILSLLKHLHQLREARFIMGDYDASILLLDFFASVRAVKLTEKQLHALILVYEKDMTQKEAGEILGISQQAVNDHINSAVTKIAKYNKKIEEVSRDETSRD